MDTIQRYYEKKGMSYYLGQDKENVHQKILDLIGKNQKILDVGCASGYLGRELKKKGAEVYGIEISEKAGKEAKKALNGVIIGDIEKINLPYPENFFDVIVCADVLEHLFDPTATLIELRNYLKDDGRLIVSLPNVANWWVRKELLLGRFEYQNTGLLDKGHLRFFTRDSAKRCFLEAGYKIVKVDLNITLPKIFRIANKIFPFSSFCKKCFPNLFSFQFLFILMKETNS